ncbi:MAG: hypothetical protein PHU14_11645, partial [Methylovulum sp.]|nr:hypothetical protein [Methylovulum sp.]
MDNMNNIACLDKRGLTLFVRGAILCARSTRPHGRRKPVLSKGENSPIITSAFLCPSKTQAFVRLVLRYGGLS